MRLSREVDAQHKRNMNYWLIAGACFLLLGMVLVWVVMRRSREQRQQNRLLLAENQHIELQNAEVENASQELNSALEQIQEQQKLLETRKGNIESSIQYARRIQRRLLSDPFLIDAHFAGYVLYYKPRDVVSGDFYWWRKVDNCIHIAIIDCTGHGVPGAMMSVLAYHLLQQWIDIHPEDSPADCLTEIHTSVRRYLKQDREDAALDGMDVAYFQIDLKTGKLKYAGARRPLWILRKGEWLDLEPTRKSIGGRATDEIQFETRSMVLHNRDRIFAFTDGVTDQFGGARKRKYTPLRLRELLKNTQDNTLQQAEIDVVQEMRAWRKGQIILDDALLFGVEFRSTQNG